MSRKGIILAIIIFIGLGLYVFLVEKKKPISEGKEVILKFDKDKAKRLTLIQDKSEIILEKDKDGKWQITSPLTTKADDEVIKEMINDLSSLEASQSLEVAPSEWEDFGLKKPGCQVSVLIDGSEETLSFGDKNPAGTSIYIRMRGKDKTYLVSTYLANSFKKEIFDLREKRVLLFDKEKVSGINLSYEGEKILLEKHGEEWQIIEPVKDKGDNYEIDKLISSLHELKASGFIDEVKEEASYGLAEPQVKCIIWIGAEKIAQAAVFGKIFKEEENELQYARRELLPTVFKIEQSKVNDLKKTVFDLRNKIILSFEKDTVEKIELIYPEKGLVLEKDKEAKWFLGGIEKIELDSDKINDLLWDLIDLKAKGIISEEINNPSLYGLDTPQVKVVIKAQGNEKAILLGKEAKEKEDTIYAQLFGDPRLFLVSSDLLTNLKKEPSDLKKEEKEEVEEKGEEEK